MYLKKLNEDYEIRELDTPTFAKLNELPHRKFFDDDKNIFRLRENLNDQELEKMKALRANMGNPFRLNLGLFYREDFVGWAWGFQESAETYYMCNSAVFPEHRNRGLYTALMNSTLEIVNGMGFQRIYSRHTATNNAVLIPKLKAGFLITHFELSDAFGVLVHLAYFPKEDRRKMLHYRSGQQGLDEQIKKLLGI